MKKGRKRMKKGKRMAKKRMIYKVREKGCESGKVWSVLWPPMLCPPLNANPESLINLDPADHVEQVYHGACPCRYPPQQVLAKRN